MALCRGAGCEQRSRGGVRAVIAGWGTSGDRGAFGVEEARESQGGIAPEGGWWAQCLRAGKTSHRQSVTVA